MNFVSILKRRFNQEEGALQSKKVKLQEITRQEEKEKEHVHAAERKARDNNAKDRNAFEGSRNTEGF